MKLTATALTKAGKLIKIGRTTSGMGKVISFSMKSGAVVEGSSVLEVEAAPQMIIESELEASKALGILKPH